MVKFKSYLHLLSEQTVLSLGYDVANLALIVPFNGGVACILYNHLHPISTAS